MKMFKKSVCMCVAFGLLFVFGGCSEEGPTTDAKALLQRSVYNLLETSSMRFSVDLLAEIPEGEEGMVADIAVSGAFSNLDSENKGEELTMVAKIEAPDERNFRADFAVKTVGPDFYVKLLDLPEVPGLSVEAFSDFAGPWWQISMESFGEEDMGVQFFGDFGASGDQLDEDTREMKDLLLQFDFFDEVVFEGDEDVSGRSAYRYSVILDKEEIYNYAGKLVEIGGEEAKESPEFSLVEFLATADFDGDVWVDAETSTLVKVDGVAKIVDPDDGAVSNVELVVSFSDLNQPFSIEPPVDYEIFDLGMFFSAILQSGMF